MSQDRPLLDFQSIIANVGKMVEREGELQEAEEKLLSATVKLARLEESDLVLPLTDWKTDEERSGTLVNISKRNYRALKEQADFLGITVDAHVTNILKRAMAEKKVLPARPGEDMTAALNRNLHRLLLEE